VDGFFDAADALARNPVGLAEREALLGRARGLVDEIRRRHDALAAFQRALDDEAVGLARTADDALTRIARLNVEIAARENGGKPAGDLRDERRRALDELGRTLRIAVLEDPSGGTVRVSAASGLVLVDGGAINYRIATRASGVNLDGFALHEVGVQTPTGAFLQVPAVFADGAIGGVLDVRDGGVVAAADNLDTLVAGDGSNPGLVGAVNAVQQAGVDLDGNSAAAVPLLGGTGAADVAVVLTDPRRIAAALSTEPGDNRNAIALADLRAASFAAFGDTTIAGFLAVEQARVGEDAALAQDRAAATDLVAAALEQERDAVSGVNLNEELTNLLRYQRAFQASAQVIGVTNTALEALFGLAR
jgi:flagellar hook-associated protein 1 FlgK